MGRDSRVVCLSAQGSTYITPVCGSLAHGRRPDYSGIREGFLREVMQQLHPQTGRGEKGVAPGRETYEFHHCG